MPAGTNVGTIFLDLQVTHNLPQQIQNASNSAASGISSSIGGIFKNLVAGFAIGTAINALKQFGSAAIEVASDLAEVQNVVNTAFGNLKQDCEDLADVAIEEFGISELAAKKTSSSFMAMASSMGIASEDASKMAINVTKLSADVASFYNLSQEEAATKLKGIFTGEGEALKELGVIMQESTLSQYAMDQGIKTAYKDMDQSQKVALRYKYVMEQLSLAQGDFSKTSDGWSNQTKVLQENWKQFQATIGQGLIKVFNPLLQMINEIVGALNELATTMSQKFGWGEAEEEAKTSAKNIGEALVSETDAAAEESKKILGALAGFDEINNLFSNKDDKNKTSGEEFDIFGDEYTDQKKAEQKENIFSAMINNIKNKAQELWKEFGQPVWDAIQPAINWLKDEVFPWISEKVQSLGEIFSDLWQNRISPYLRTLRDLWINVFQNVALPIIKNLFETISDWWDNSGEKLFSTILNFILSFRQLIANIADVIVTYLGPIFKDFINLCVDNLGQAFTIITNIITGILNIFIKLFDDLAACFADFENICKGIINAVISAVNVVIDAINSISLDVPDWVPGIGGQTIGFNLDNIPYLAKGGIVTEPTLAMIGEGSQDEAVMPLDTMREMIAQTVAEVLAEYNLQNEQPEQDLYLTLNIGDNTIIDTVVKAINRKTRNNGKEVILSL